MDLVTIVAGGALMVVVIILVGRKVLDRQQQQEKSEQLTHQLDQKIWGQSHNQHQQLINNSRSERVPKEATSFRFSRLLEEQEDQSDPRNEAKKTTKEETKKGLQQQKQELRDGEMDYNHYRMSYKEKVKYLFLISLGILFISYVFYRSAVVSLVACTMSLYFIRFVREHLCDKRKQALADEFNEGLYVIGTALSAGKSLEEAFKESIKEMKEKEFPLIHHEFSLIVNRIEVNENIEVAVMDFARRSHVEDIQNFADILVTSKRTEGDIISIIRRTMTMMSEKMEIKREIETNIAQKKYEQKILMAMPLFIIIFLSVSSKGYLDPLYTTFGGRIAMTVALMVMLVCYKVSSKITDIQV